MRSFLRTFFPCQCCWKWSITISPTPCHQSHQQLTVLHLKHIHLKWMVVKWFLSNPLHHHSTSCQSISKMHFLYCRCNNKMSCLQIIVSHSQGWSQFTTYNFIYLLAKWIEYDYLNRDMRGACMEFQTNWKARPPHIQTIDPEAIVDKNVSFCNISGWLKTPKPQLLRRSTKIWSYFTYLPV